MNKYYIDYFTERKWRVMWYDEFDHIHNYNDMPSIIYSDGTEIYYRHGLYHRDDGPANIWIDEDQVLIRWYHDNIRYTPKCIKL